MPATIHELNARSKKVRAMVAAIDDLAARSGLSHSDSAALASVLHDWEVEHWNSLALSAGSRPPSATTRSMILAIFDDRAKRSA